MDGNRENSRGRELRAGRRRLLQDVECDQARTALSAVLDSEDPIVAWPLLHEHLARCADCRRWQQAAHDLTRRTRLQRDGVAPSPPEALIAAARSYRLPRPVWRRSAALVRMGLVVVAGVQLALSVPLLILGSDRGAPIHVAHEMGSLDVAVAIGLLVAVRRPARALGMLTLIGTAALLLTVTAGTDLASGRTTWTDETPHLLVLAGWVLLRRLVALSPSGGERPSSPIAFLAEARRRLAAIAGERNPAPSTPTLTRASAPGTAEAAVGSSGDQRMAS